MHRGTPHTTSPQNKTTGHLKAGPSAGWSLLVLSALLAVTSWSLVATAAEITLTTSNDPVSGNQRTDDLYTAEAALAIELRDHGFELRERMFTDHQRGLRFDETTLELNRPFTVAGWEAEAGVGILHVGRGLLGESVQNAVHRLVGSEEEDLRYAADHRLYPHARLTLTRPLVASDALGRVSGRVEALAAPGFHSSLRVGVETVRPLGRGWALLAGVAGVVHDVDSSLLGEVIAANGVAWDLGVEWRKLFLVYSENAYGTESRHLTLGYRFDGRAVARWLGR